MKAGGPAPRYPAMAASSSAHLARLAGIGGDIGCSAFVAFAYLAHARRLSPALAQSIRYDRAAVYDWYLTAYAATRLPERAPLSDDDIAWLMEEVILPGVAFRLPRVVSWAALEPFSQGGGPLADGEEAALALWWAKTAAPALGVEDRLVPARYWALCASAAPVAWSIWTPLRVARFVSEPRRKRRHVQVERADDREQGGENQTPHETGRAPSSNSRG